MQAATFSWDGFQLDGAYDSATKTGSYELSAVYESYPDYTLYPRIRFTTSRTGMTTTLKASNFIMLAYGDNWIQTSLGEVIDACNTVDTDSCFLHGWVSYMDEASMDLVGASDYDIEVSGTKTVYLGFATMSDWENISNDHGTRDWKKYYGWVELTVSPTGITLGHSALRLDGKPIVVGTTETVPEPAAGALALLGAALLFRRRRIGNEHL